MTPEYIVERHVLCNVTGLVTELVECDSDVGRDLMYGDPESEMRAYDAYEVWIVSPWLAKRLKACNHRVIEHCYRFYWARGGAGQSIALDPVIVEIAKGET